MKMPAHEFATYVDNLIEGFSNEDYHQRSGRVKRAIEELLPLSRLAVALKQPGLTVEVEAFENSGRPDGHVWITGFREIDFEVQVTFAGYEHAEALRSHLLAHQGFVAGAGPIKKDKSGTIITTMAAEDIDAPLVRLATSIRARFVAKAAMPYPPETVLVVAFEDMELRGRGWWSMLYAAIDSVGGLDQGIFAQVYLFNGFSNELQQAA